MSARTLASGATWASGSIGLACGAAYTDGAIAALLVTLAAALSLGWALRDPRRMRSTLSHRVTPAVPVQPAGRQASVVPARPLRPTHAVLHAVR